MPPAILVENLSKQYKIGRSQQRHDTLRDALVDGFKRLNVRTFQRSNVPEDTIWALKDVSFEVQPGEVLGIIGRNGAGKSTLLKILSRITEPTSGRAVINGRVGSLLEVGTGFHPELTGRENIYLNGAILGMTRKEIEKKFDEIVAFSEIEKFLDTPVKRYSSGMYVRLAFAVAAHLEPEILLVDEVLAVGDAAFQKKCLGKMGDVAKEGRTILFVSHNLIALKNLCPRAIWLNNGELTKEGLSPDVISEYLKLQSTKKYEQIWDTPDIALGNELVRIHRVWIESENGVVGAGFPRETPINIGIEYWHFAQDAQLHVTLHIYVEQQVIAFTTGSSQDPDWKEVSMRNGLIQSICQIPSFFLNTGQHIVNLLFVKDRSRVVFSLEEALSFEVVETVQRAGAWYKKEPGVVRPLFPWKSKYLSDIVAESSKGVQK